MGEARFTPGPWTVPHFARPEVNCMCKFVLSDQYMGAVAWVHCSGEGDDWQAHGDSPRFDEAVANAHLIAAAPELYEALKALQLQALQSPLNSPANEWGWEALAMTKSALAKARGEPRPADTREGDA